MTVNPLSLPTSLDRAAVFAAARGVAPFFDERLKLWVVLDHETVSALLSDERLRVPELGPALAVVEQRYGIALPNLEWVANELPLVLNGADHKRTRGGLAKLLSADRKTGGMWREPVSDIVRSQVTKEGTVEAVRDVLLPIVNTVFGTLAGIDASFEPLTLTRVFDHYASYRQLLAAEQHVADLRRRLGDAGIPASLIGAHAAMIILGKDSLLTSLSEGLIDFSLACRGRRLDDLSVRQPRLFGGVTVGERLVARPFSFAGADFEEGQRVRLYFQGFGFLESETERLAMFGAGGHACLGRALALEVWTLLAAEIRAIPLTLKSVAFEYQRNSMFTMPRFIKLELA
jgi:cytochrome P450